MKALILAGGFGTRLREITGEDIPKPLVPIAGKPFLHHQIKSLREQGITDIVLAVHYNAEKIRDHFGNGKRHGVEITYSDEEIPLGTAGAIKNAQRYIGKERFLTMNGDTYADLRLEDFLKFHEERKKLENVGSVAVTECEDSRNFGKINLEGEFLTGFEEKAAGEKGKVYINGGVYIFEPKIFEIIPEGKKVSLEKEVFPELAKERKLLAYPFKEYFIDIGRPETYKQLRREMVDAMAMAPEGSIRHAIDRMNKNEEGLIFVVGQNRELRGVVTSALVNLHLAKPQASLEDSLEKIMLSEGLSFAREGDSPDKVAEIMLPRTNRLPILNSQNQIVDIVYRQEAIERKQAPVYRGKAPLRISFSGGGTDKEDYFIRFGTGIVISATIDRYCHASAKPRQDLIVRINNCGGEEVLDLRKGKIPINQKNPLIKAVINTLKPDFGFDLYLQNDVPPQRGLGSSGSFAVLLTDLITEMQGKYLTSDQVAELARKAEVQELGIRGGWQDQYAAKIGGFNLIEFSKGKIIPSSLLLSPEVVNELEESLVLCYVGKAHDSGKVHEAQEKKFEEQEEKIKYSLEQLKEIAFGIRNCLVSKNPSRVRQIGEYLHESWLIKKGLAAAISSSDIDGIYQKGLDYGAVGGKLLGAGNGGYMLFFCAPEKRKRLYDKLKADGLETLDFRFERHPAGSQIWKVHS